MHVASAPRSTPEVSYMKNKNDFIDPIRIPWVGIGFLILFLAMIPVWPIQGNWFGIPAWAAFALLVSVFTSLFTAYVILSVWQDPGEGGEADD